MAMGITMSENRLDLCGERLYDRVRHLDKRMYVEAATEEAPRPVQAQFDRLSAAFGAA